MRWERTCALKHTAVLATALFSSPSGSKARNQEVRDSELDSLPSMSPISPIRIFRPNPNLEIAFDVRTRNPLYVLERLSGLPQSSSSSKRGNRRPHFFEEKSLPEEYRSRPGSYRHSGYDRGHLAAAANHSHNEKEMIDTFNLCNVSPQVHSMNISIWAQLEEWSRRVAEREYRQHQATTYVVTGPLWLPNDQLSDKLFSFQYNAIGTPPSLISIPTHFFKVILVKTPDNSLIKFACFVIPNKESEGNDSGRSHYRSLVDYLVPWTKLEAVSGLQFFPSLLNSMNGVVRLSADSLTNEIMKYKNPPKQKAIGYDNYIASPPRKGKSSLITSTKLEHLCKGGKCQ